MTVRKKPRKEGRMEPQAMDHVPPTPVERERNKHHYPWVAIFLLVGLFLSGVMFFVLPLMEAIQRTS